eukprot:gene32604-42224_t
MKREFEIQMDSCGSQMSELRHSFQRTQGPECRDNDHKIIVNTRLLSPLCVMNAMTRVHKLRAFRKIVLAAKAYTTRKRLRRYAQGFPNLAEEIQQDRGLQQDLQCSAAGQDPPPLEEVDGLFSLEDAAPGHPGHQIPGHGPDGYVKHTVLHYYNFRRGLIALQGLCRRFPFMRRFAYDIYYYRAAVRLQRRGFFVRSHLFDSRVKDIRYSASLNNYPKLLFYTQKYPEMLNELDHDGSTSALLLSLHLSASLCISVSHLLYAAKRTLKLLRKAGLDHNVLNLSGFTVLHLAIMSAAAGRDDCTLNMLDGCGFDEDTLTPDGKTWQLLADGHDSQQPDYYGTTPLQATCKIGNLAIVTELLQHGADDTSSSSITPPSPPATQSPSPTFISLLGWRGTRRLHSSAGQRVGKKPRGSAAAAAAAEIRRLPEPADAAVPVRGSWSRQTLRGSLSFMAPMCTPDSLGRKASHNGVYANQQADSGALTGRTDVGDGSITGHHAIPFRKCNYILPVVNLPFPFHFPARTNTARTERDRNKDYSAARGGGRLRLPGRGGKLSSATRLAVEGGLFELKYAMHLLLEGAFPSFQNSAGNQPAHLATRNNQVELLKQICVYDQHIGRVNYAHQTPLGVAKFHRFKSHYKRVDVRHGRYLVGQGHRRRELAVAGDWEVMVNHRSERLFVNRRTREVTTVGRSGRGSSVRCKILADWLTVCCVRLVSASLVASAAKNVLVPMHRNVVMVRDDPSAATNLNKNAYYREYDANKADVERRHHPEVRPEEAGRHYHTLSLAHHPSNRCSTVVHTCLYGGQEAATPGQEGQDPAAIFVRLRAAVQEVKGRNQTPRGQQDPVARPNASVPTKILQCGRRWGSQQKQCVAQGLCAQEGAAAAWPAWLALKARPWRRAMRIRKRLPTTLADWQIIIDRAGKRKWNLSLSAILSGRRSWEGISRSGRSRARLIPRNHYPVDPRFAEQGTPSSPLVIFTGALVKLGFNAHAEFIGEITSNANKELALEGRSWNLTLERAKKEVSRGVSVVCAAEVDILGKYLHDIWRRYREAASIGACSIRI